MWPKILLELLPHFARLAPVADKLLSNRSAGDTAKEAALTAMAEGVRGDLDQLTEAHSGIYRQLNEQSAQLSGIAAETAHAVAAVESVEARITGLERSAALAMRLSAISLIALAAVLVLLLLVLLKLPR
jgi:uncharacterized membrane protein